MEKLTYRQKKTYLLADDLDTFLLIGNVKNEPLDTFVITFLKPLLLNGKNVVDYFILCCNTDKVLYEMSLDMRRIFFQFWL